MTCDHVDCEAEAEWSLEVCPMPNDGVSVVYACTQPTLSDAPEAHQMSVMGQIDAELKRWKQAKLAGESAAGRRTT